MHSASDALSIARWLVFERGFSVIPVDHPDATRFAGDPSKIGKAPCFAWKPFQTAVPTDDNLVTWFANGTPRNPAIVTGAVSQIVVVDGDDRDAVAWMTAHLPATEMRTRTAKGEHWFFRYPGRPIRNKARIQTGQGQLQLDVRADGGYVLAPLAKHACGITYARLGTWPTVDQLPVFDLTWLEPAAVVDPEARPLRRAHARSAGETHEHVLRRAEKYVSATPPAVQGQGGDAHTFRLACKLVRGFGLSDRETVDLLRPWNVTCQPPWTDQALEEKIRSARQNGTEPMGGRADRPRAGVSAQPRPPMVSVAAETILPFRTAADLARDQPSAPLWFVPGFIAPAVVVEIVGKLKASGKTTFIAWLVRAVLGGQDFLGWSTRRTAVVWLTEERPPSFLQTLTRAGLTDRTDLHVLHWHDVKALPWPQLMQLVTAYAERVGAGVVIVDTVSQFAGLRGDAENNSGDALVAVEPLQAAAAEGLAVVAVRHERKGGGEVGESGRGSSAFSGAVDIVVAIRRGEGQTKPTIRVLHTLSRFTETPDTLVIELTGEGYVALGTVGTVAVQEAQRVLRDRLPTTPDDALKLDDLLGGAEPRIARTVAQAALKALSELGAVQCLGSGKKGSPYRYFRAVEVSAATQITRSGRNQNGGSDAG